MRIHHQTTTNLLRIGLSSSFFLFLLLGNRSGVLITDLALHTDKVGNIAGGIAKSSNKELIPKGRTVHTVVQETDRHVVTLLNGLTDAFHMLRVGFGTLEETAVASQNLIKRVARQVEETLRGVDNGIVGKTGIRDHKVLLGSLEGLDEGEIGIVQDLVGNSLAAGEQTIDGHAFLLVQENSSLLVAEMRTNGALELFVFFLEEGNGLLERLEEEFLADATALGVFAVAFPKDEFGEQFRLIKQKSFDVPALDLLLLAHLAVSFLLLGSRILQVMGSLRDMTEGNRLGGSSSPGKAHSRRLFAVLHELRGVQTTTGGYLLEGASRCLARGHGRDLGLTGVESALLAEEDGVSIGSEDDVSKDVVEVERVRSAGSHGGLRVGAEAIGRGEQRGGNVGISHSRTTRMG